MLKMEGRGRFVLMVGLLVVAFVPAQCDESAKPVSTVLRASWRDTPLLLEASEFIAEYKDSLFWNFINQTKSLRTLNLTDKDTYNGVLEIAESLLPSSVYNLLVFALSLRQYSPAIEMFQQVAMEQLSMLSGRNCVAFVQVGREVVCSPDEIDTIVSLANVSDSVFEFDHIHRSSLLGSRPLAVLYAELGTPEFEQFHDVLISLSNSGQVVYALRHYIKDRSDVQPLLSGYGVELSVKSTEYKAMDDSKVQGDESRSVDQTQGDDEVEGFLFNTLRTRYPDLSSELDEYRSHLVQGSREMPELKVWQLQDLGFQAAQRIVSATPELRLKVMKDIAQNLPMQAKSLSRTQVSKELWNEITKNQKVLQSVGVSPGDSILLLNDIILAEEQIDIYHMVDMILSEIRVQESLHHLSIAPSFFRELLLVPVHSRSTTFALDVRSESVVFINDLENDRVYSSWPRSLKTFLQPSYPGMLRQVARNVFNIVFVLDPASEDGKELVEYVKLFLDHLVPARFGLLLVPQETSEVGVALCRGFSYLSVHETPRQALKWLYKVQSSSLMDDLTVDGVVANFQSEYKTTPTTDVFNETYDQLCQSSREFFEAKGFGSSPQVLVNGAQISMDTDIEMSIVGKIQQQTYEVQQAVFTNRLSDKMNVYDYFLNRSNVLQRVNQHIVAQSTVHNLCGKVSSDASSASPEDIAATVANSLHYVTSKEGEFLLKELSIWVVVDLGTEQGRQVARNAISYTLTSDLVQVALVHNPSDSSSPPSLLATAVEASLSHLTPSKAWSLVTSLLELEDPQDRAAILSLASEAGVGESKMEKFLEDEAVFKTMQNHRIFSSRVLKLEPGQTALLSNGRLIGPLSPSESFVAADFAMLYQLESSSHAAALSQAMAEVEVHSLEPDDDTVEFRSQLVMKVASLLRSQPRKRRLPQLPALTNNYSAVHLPGPEGELNIEMVVFLDPLSPSTQRLAPLLQALHVALNLDLTIYPNPISKLSQMPINSFYRYVIDPELSFSEDGRLSSGSMAVFGDLPHSPLLTLQLDVPHSWLVEAVWSPHDLDNIHLAGLPQGTGVHADFTLKHILVEGQCFDESTDHPVPGLEYVLGTSSQPDLFDTIVMANLGYFQLKASPGAWSLRLRQGRSSEIYEIKSHLGGDSFVNHSSDEVPINVKSFTGSGAMVRVEKKQGMESVSLLAGDAESASEKKEKKEGNLWNSLSNFLHGRKSDKDEDSGADKLEVGANETINVFSIASGHLYERFLRIMMLSVLKHTRNPVKFWFLKNFLSPPFKDFIPVMAERYGFEYELVEYQWPRWLHGQTQKQRIIWGYKILFLDVLFPLSVKKIIFVDADQIVRADLKELLEIPLDGAPYGYTPFCNDRPDMAGFRFWESGYWKNHLGNRRYHISALYVVDLMRFRQLAAGDRLRGQYQALSQDPNSLANLDQDLPNNMIHMVPIKSLPQEWLWCETWCSLESKEKAKTIDLCNNPLTKEPKLKSAVRIVAEWTSYDQEIKGLWEEHFSAKTTPTELPITKQPPSVHEHIITESDAKKHTEL